MQIQCFPFEKGGGVYLVQSNISGNATINISSKLPNYQELTINNFFVILKRITFETAVYRTTQYPGITAYNASTGVISITGYVNASSHNYTTVFDLYYLTAEIGDLTS